MRHLLTRVSLMFGILALSAAPVMAQVTTGMEAESDDEFAPTLDQAVFEPNDEPLTDGAQLGGEEIMPSVSGDSQSAGLNSTGNEVAVEGIQATDDSEFFDIFTEFSGLNAKEYTADNVPTGGFGLWWKGVTETVSLAFTFNPVKKAEKQVRFAEERMSMAAAMIEKAADDPKLQDKALDMIGKAQKFMDKVEDGKSKWLSEDGEARDNLLKNLGTHTALREAAFDAIEEKLPEEALDKFQDVRDQGHMAGRRLMTALENENIPEEVLDHLMGVKQRVELFSEDLGIFKDVKKELLDLRAQGEDGIGEALDALHEERKNSLRKRGENLVGDDSEWLKSDFAPVKPSEFLEGEGLVGVPGVTIFPGATELRARILDSVQEQVPDFAPRGWILDRGEAGDNIGSSGEDGLVGVPGVGMDADGDGLTTDADGDGHILPPPSTQPLIDAILGVPVAPESDALRLLPPPLGDEGLIIDIDGLRLPPPPEDGATMDGESGMAAPGEEVMGIVVEDMPAEDGLAAPGEEEGIIVVNTPGEDGLAAPGEEEGIIVIGTLEGMDVETDNIEYIAPILAPLRLY